MGPAGEKPLVDKVPEKDCPRSAVIDPATGMIRFTVPLPVRSEEARDVFAVPLNIRVSGSLEGAWRTVPLPAK